jgi:HlyD family secretion protein
LRFTPSVRSVAGAPAGFDKGGGIVSSLMPRPPASSSAPKAAAGSGAAARQVWVLRDNRPVAVAIKPGVSDGKMTEVAAGDLQPGMQVITDQRSAATS